LVGVELDDPSTPQGAHLRSQLFSRFRRCHAPSRTDYWRMVKADPTSIDVAQQSSMSLNGQIKWADDRSIYFLLLGLVRSMARALFLKGVMDFAGKRTIATRSKLTIASQPRTMQSRIPSPSPRRDGICSLSTRPCLDLPL
jgi:hypothetical protein